MTLSRREMLGALAAAPVSAASAPYFGLHDFIEKHPKAVFIRRTQVPHKMDRDAKLRELDDWVSNFRSVCRVALYEKPQELEKLGVMVLNVPRRTAKKAETAAKPAD